MFCITFPGGAYGNFVSWTLEWMQGNFPADYRPFTAQKNSHNWSSNQVSTVDQACTNVRNNTILHPIQDSSTRIVDSYDKLFNHYDKIVALHPAKDDFIWHMNNKLTKIYKSGWIAARMAANHDALLSEGLANWQGNEHWETREHLSFYLWDQHIAEVRFNDVESYSNPRFKKIEINMIRDQFVDTFMALADWLEIEVVRSIADIELLQKDWLKNEPNLHKDKLIKDLTSAIINDKFMEMKDLSIFDEAIIQRNLRLEGYEIECFELNTWPTDTIKLRELIYEN